MPTPPTLLGSGDATTGAQGALASNGALTGQVWSLTRDNQLRALLGGALEAFSPPGILSGGTVLTNGALSVKVVAPTTYLYAGVAIRYNDDQVYNGCDDNATSTVWWRLERTPADQALPEAADTYAVAFTRTLDASRPDTTWAPLATVVMLSGALVSITDLAGKFVVHPGRTGRAAVVYAANANRTLTAAEQNSGILEVTSGVSLSTQRNLVLASLADGQDWLVFNNTTGSQNIQVIGATGTGVVIPNGTSARVYCDGTNVVEHRTLAAGAPPTGSAGGVLSGTYPNPTLATPYATAFLLMGA